MEIQKPNPNVPEQAQPWARDTNADIAALKTSFANLAERVDAIDRGDGEQANTFAVIYQRLEKIEYELEFLYGAVGQNYPPGSAPPPTVPVTPTYTTIEVGPDWSRTWGSSSYYTGGGDEYTNGSYLYQGSNPENKVGLVKFNVGAARGKTIVSAYLFLQNINSAYSNPFTARLGTHGYVTAPTSKPGRQNGFDVGWSRGEGKWHPLPSWTYGGLSNGSIQGFSTGASGASDADSAWFQGAGMSKAPRLRITYAS